ncbi:hypothetical protein BVY04_05310 [bacterium M21]|nr:hypothetical protein BVY04_05310 [bacterium M21]
MNLREAQNIVEEEVLRKYPDCGLLTENTLDLEKCFVFFYQTSKFIETRNIMDSRIGHGPVFVDKLSGKVFETGSAYSVEQYVASFNLTGDPYGNIQTPDELGLRRTIEVTGYDEGYDGLAAIESLKRITGKGNKEIKDEIGAILKKRPLQLELPDGETAMELADALTENGARTKVIWNANKNSEPSGSR